MTFQRPAVNAVNLKPSITVVMPLYNKGPYVVAAIESALAQGPHVLEVLVIDDGSTDDGPAKVAKLEMIEPRVHLLRQRNQGVSSARNAGIASAKGSHIAFLDADDLLVAGYVEAIIRLIGKYPHAGLYATGFTRVEDPTAAIAHTPSPIGARDEIMLGFFDKWRRSAPFYTCSVCIPVKVITDAKLGFPAGERLGEDQDVWFRLAEAHEIAYCSAPLVLYRINVVGSLTAGSGVRDVLPCYARLAERAESPGYPARHRAGALRLVAAHYINVARARKRIGDRKGSLELMWSRRAWRHPAYWLRTLPGILSPGPGPVAPAT